MPLTYIEKEKLLQNEWEKRKKEAIIWERVEDVDN